MAFTDMGAETSAPQQMIPREPPQVDEPRRRLVKRWEDCIARAKKHHKCAFDRMREDMAFAFKHGIGAQWPDQSPDDERYIANIVQRHIQTRVAALYAKHPTVVARRRQRLDFAIWDGSLQSLADAKAQVEVAVQNGMTPPMQAVMLLQDAEQGLAARRKLDSIGKTLEALFRYALKEQVPDFKRAMKQLVRRVQTCGVGYVRLGYQREMSRRAEDQARIQDITERLQTIERMQSDLVDGVLDPATAAEAEELRAALDAVMSEPEIVAREGLTFDFPLATRVIVDPGCRQIIDFVGATWLAEEIPMSVNQIKEVYGVDVGRAHDRYDPKSLGDEERSRGRIGEADAEDDHALVFLVFDRKTGLKYTICKGYPDFLEEPAPPEITLERFFPYYPLAFNAIESEDEVFPPSDVRLLMHIQREYNRLKESLRQHRIANRPLYVTPAGALEEADMEGGGAPALDNYAAHTVLRLNGLKDGEDIKNKLQPVQKVAIDPNLYETNGVFQDMQRVVGSQEANLGGTGNATATESSIAEGSRLSSLASNVDDLDDLLSSLARDAGQVLLLHMGADTVTEIVGPGAVWPEVTRSQVAKEIFLDIEAGSSGRPNKAQEIANLERVGQILVQIPGISPEWLARYTLRILDDKLDLTDAIAAGAPSIVAQNQMTQPSTGDPMTDPAQQGGRGALNQPQPPGATPGPQPAFPALMQ